MGPPVAKVLSSGLRPHPGPSANKLTGGHQLRGSARIAARKPAVSGTKCLGRALLRGGGRELSSEVDESQKSATSWAHLGAPSSTGTGAKHAVLQVQWARHRIVLYNVHVSRKSDTAHSGGEGTRTLDLRLAKPPLFQLSYTPKQERRAWHATLDVRLWDWQL
jgi:hypothetical protein